MDRINVYSYPADEAPYLDGWFDRNGAEEFDEGTFWDGNNHISLVTHSQWDHETLYKTAGARWVLSRWSQRQGSVATREFVSEDRARTWLLTNEVDWAVEKHFGRIEDEKGPGGRPEIGPAVHFRLPEELLTAVDAHAAEQSTTRAAAMRDLLTAALRRTRRPYADSEA